MIVNIAGTSGAGKSTLARNLMDWAKERGSACVARDHETPFTLISKGNVFSKSVILLGKYNSPTGGCDTIKDVKKVFEAVREHYAQGYHVVYEGLFVMNMTRGPELASEVGQDLAILQLTTSLAQCHESINLRRAARGEGELKNKENTNGNFTRAGNYCAKMRDAGARVIPVERTQALRKLTRLLGDTEAEAG